MRERMIVSSGEGMDRQGDKSSDDKMEKRVDGMTDER